ncbi:hypothetical protein K469DRAFT_716492 [Zopfia rhizophila CBS 207.26]|uniref:Transcription factor domain-containing protein n=1 Tax=Zopfia rhizophila CBS 207.26 TaxID=1314779 RepID=A0A6A6DLB2_9PEZI|nr:hypothetical protein K469DRAFT_716492 [Zopfia rhizophila CBS 207.26]
MRIIKDTLGVAGNDVPQSIIFAVSLLAFGCSIDGDWDQARGHVEALQRIIDSCGGVHTLDFELQRTVTWTAYRVSAALRLPPIFPIPRFLNVGPSPLAFLDDAQIRAWRTVKRFPKDSSFVFDIVVRLHQLGLATSAEWYGEMDQRALSNMYFEALECTVVAQLDEPWSATIAAGAQRQEAATMFKIWAAGLPVFVCGTIRHVRSRLGMIIVERRICDPLLARVRDLLDSLGGYHAWPRGKNLEPVLATLFYCVESCESIDAWRPWCMDALRKVVEMLKIKSVDEFKKVLDHFPSTNEYRNAADEIWREMTQGGSAASTPSLTFSTLQ